MSMFHLVCTSGMVCLFLVGCTRVPPVNDHKIKAVVNSRINKGVHWNQGYLEDRQVQFAVKRMLQQELTVDTAVQIALLNNSEIQATFEEVGVAQADLVQAGLFQNPIFDGYIRFPNQPSLELNTAFSVTQCFLDLFLIPLRKKIAAVELEQAQFRVANAVLNLAFEVQETFYSLAAEKSKNALLATLVQATGVANQLAIAQREQGNINDINLHVYVNEYLVSNVDFTQSQTTIIHLRQKMNRLLGLSSCDLCWQMSKDLPEIPCEEVSSDCLESVALSQRLDLKVARLEVERTARMLGIKQWWAYTNISAGFSTEHEAEGFQESGVAVAGSIPIFNYGQADRARLYSLLRQRHSRLKTLEIDVLSEVRSARDRLVVNRNLVLTYQRELLPFQKNLVATSQKFYNTMTLSVYKLLQAKKQELQMEIEYQLNLRDYWLSRVALERSVGGSLCLGEKR